MLLEINSTLIWTIAGVVVAVIAVIVALLIHQSNKKTKKYDEIKDLQVSCNRLKVAMDIGKINTLLSQVVSLCKEAQTDIGFNTGNDLKNIASEVKLYWNEALIKLDALHDENLKKDLSDIMSQYWTCLSDVEFIVSALGQKTENFNEMLTSNNSQELQDVVSTSVNLYKNEFECLSQIISLRFKDIEIPSFDSKIDDLLATKLKGYTISGNSFTIKLRAATGDAVAQFLLGLYYAKKNKPKETFKWLLKAAKQGLAPAQYCVGTCYGKGEGIEKDGKKAFEWFLKAAKQGLAEAQHNVGVCYDKGEGIKKDEKKAFEWYLKAAKTGLAIAQYNVGVCYDKGEGIKKDEKKAFEWFLKAAEQGLAIAHCNVGNYYRKGKGIEKDEKAAFEWYLKAAKTGLAKAQYNVGVCYDKGEGIKKDEKKAFEWFLKAAKQGLAEAQYNVGVCYKNGEGIEKDEKAAFEWCLKASKQGYAAAQLAVGVSYLLGDGVDQDFSLAFKWFTKATTQHETGAYCYLGLMYWNEKGVPKSPYIAVKYYTIDAENGFPYAQYLLGKCYETGIGVDEVDMGNAMYWYRKAAEQGEEKAIEKLKELGE